MMIDLSKMSEADRRLNVESRILEVVTNFGGQQIVAGPAMERMVGLLRCAFDELAFEGWLPTVKEARS